MSWPFDQGAHPEGWEDRKLRSILVRRKRYGRPDLPLLSVNLPVGVNQREERDGRPAPSLDLSGYQEVRPGDVVMNQLGKPHGAIGVSPYHGITSPAYFVAEVLPAAHPGYVHHLLRSELFVQEYQRRGKNQPPNQFDISWDQFRDIDITLPPLAEQRAIADYLDTETARIDALITKKQQLIHLLEERRKSAAASEVAGVGQHGQRKSKVPWVESLPVRWAEASLKLVAQLGSGHTPSRNRPEWWRPEECKIPWITTGEVSQMRSDRLEYLESTRERISAVGMANSSACLHPANSVVLCRTAASAGYSAIMRTPMATSQDIVVWTCGPLLRPRYLLLCLRAMRSDLLDRLAMGSTHKTIYMPDVESIRVPLPSVVEQDAIVNRVWSAWARIDSAVELLQSQVACFRDRRSALISSAVTGEHQLPGVI